MPTNRKRASSKLPTQRATKRSEQAISAAELCNCPPLSSLHAVSPPYYAASEEEGRDRARVSGPPGVAGGTEMADYERIVPVSPQLNERLRASLDAFFPRLTSLSLLLLHVSQLEPAPIAQAPAHLYKRRRYHVAASLLEQILVNVRRVIRTDDEMLIQEDSGVAIILPDVDRHGASIILERIYQSINLLQAETVIPPLTRETNILLGYGSYPQPGASLEHLLYHSGLLARRLTLRPALIAHRRGTTPVAFPESTPRRLSSSSEYTSNGQGLPGIPFMDLPRELPAHLKQLLPYPLARALRCAPVGRDHHYLTIATIQPISGEDMRRLQQATGMTIFLVSCKEEELNALLESEW